MGGMNYMYIPKGFYVYKWVHNDNVIYVGQSRDIKKRIAAERSDERFKIYKNPSIYIVKCRNSNEMSILEKILIDQYQPILNSLDKYSDKIDLPINTEALEWVDYENFDEYTEYLNNSDNQVNKIMELKNRIKELECENELLRKNTHYTEIETELFDLLLNIRKKMDDIRDAEYDHRSRLDEIKKDTLRDIYRISKLMDSATPNYQSFSEKIQINPSRLF